MKIREKMLLGVLCWRCWAGFSVSLWGLMNPRGNRCYGNHAAAGYCYLGRRVKNKGGWNTLIWYGGIIGLSPYYRKLNSSNG